MQGGEEYGAEANAPTFGARAQLAAVLAVVVAWVCRDATLLRAAEASVEYAAAATRAAATKVNLVIGFLQMVKEARQARLLRPRAVNVRNYFMTRDHQRASASSTKASPSSVVGVRRVASRPVGEDASCGIAERTQLHL